MVHGSLGEGVMLYMYSSLVTKPKTIRSRTLEIMGIYPLELTGT